MRDSIEAIKEYQRMLGYDFDNMDLQERTRYFRDCMAALVVEQGELAQELPWKPWRAPENQTYNKEKALLEWVDCYFFLVDQALALGFTGDQLEDAFHIKLKENMNRIKFGYNNTEDERR